MSLGDLGSRPGVPYLLMLFGSDSKSWIACWLSEPSWFRISSSGQYITTPMHISSSATLANTMFAGTQLPVPAVQLAGLGYGPSTGWQFGSCPRGQPGGSAAGVGGPTAGGGPTETGGTPRIPSRAV